MSIERWDPFRGPRPLRDLMDRFFREGLGGPMSEWMADAEGSIPLDVSESDNAFIVRASIPGVKPEDIQAQAHGDRLTIRARKQAEQQQEGENYLVRERSASAFYRTITLPAPVNAENAEATYENGVLTLKLPKAAPGRPQQIKIQGAGSNPPLPSGETSTEQSTQM